MANDNKIENNGTSYTLLVASIVIVILLYLGSWYYIDDLYNCTEQRGQFGDKFGAVNALFSGLAFAGLIFTIYLQKKELALQREELKQTKEELKGQKDQLIEQNKTLRIQRFENTFFHMMELQQQIVSDLYAKSEEEKIVDEQSSTGTVRKNTIIEHEHKGRNLFLYSFARSVHYIDIDDRHSIKAYGLGDVMEKAGFSQYDQYYTSTYFDHYFRHLYRILKFIKQNGSWLTFDEQYQYTSLLRATLSRFELVWIYYNGLSVNGRKKLKPLLEEYSMLKNLRKDLLILSKENNDMLSKINIVRADLIKEGLSGTDYEFFLSDKKNPDKYYLSAFYTSEELEGANLTYGKWIDFCSNHNIAN